MPKNKKPAGGRPAKNFEPRTAGPSYQDRKRREDGGVVKPGSKSPSHRGYRPAAEGETSSSSPEKRRWTSQEKAGRETSRGIRNQASGRPEGAVGARRDDRPRFDRDDRPRREGGAERLQGRDDRPRTERPRFERPSRENGFNRDGRPPQDRAERPRFDRDDRPRREGGAERPSYNRDDRPRTDRPRFDRPDRPRQDRDDRPRSQGGYDRPTYARDDRPRTDRPRTGGASDRPRQDRPQQDRPRFDRDRPRTDRPSSDRPRFGSDRPRFEGGSDRPRQDRPDRPRFDRPDRPRQDRDDRPRRDAGAGRDDWNRTAPSRSAEHETRIDVVHERLQAEAVDTASAETVSFGDLGLGENIVKALADLGAPSPFPIQAATVAPILEGRDVLARGRTGSGKTIAFGAPLVESILRSQAGSRREFGRAPQAIILAPTRELALQIDRTIQPIARSVGLFTTQIYGGVPQARQVGALRKGVDIIIGTPGRIEDLIEQGRLDLSQVRIAVLDEADHMCELGFLEPVQRILRHTADGSQKLLFSATLDREVAALVDEFLVNPAVYEVAGEDQSTGTIEHRVLVIDQRDKAGILTSLVDREGKTLVFARTRAFAEMLSDQFEDAGIRSVALHGDLNQARRTRNLEQLTKGRVSVLVATDVAARGIHVDDIDLVIQADPPDEYKTYMHRSGRTGRAGRTGRVVTLITRQRRRRMTEMLNRAEIDAPFEDARIGDELIEELAGRATVADLTS